MGLLTPIAVRLGAQPWLPRLLPQITWTDLRLQRATFGRGSLRDVAGLPNLLLTVPGRRTGIPRTTPLLCVPWDGDGSAPTDGPAGGLLIAGSHFGAPTPPVWTHNLRAADLVDVEYRHRHLTCTWRELAGDELGAAWEHMLTVWPNYATYTRWTERRIPVFLLAPVEPDSIAAGAAGRG